MYFRNPFTVTLLCVIGLALGFWVGHSFATSPGTIAKHTEANRKAAVPGLYYRATVTVSKIPGSYGLWFDANTHALLNPAGGSYGYVKDDFAPLGAKVEVYEIQPGGRWYYIRLGVDYEPRPYPPGFDPVTLPSHP